MSAWWRHWNNVKDRASGEEGSAEEESKESPAKEAQEKREGTD